jgi:poly(hydroxyalkanoate) depolymerase family esterase
LQQEYRVTGLGQTTDKLARYRRQWQDFLAKAKSSGPTVGDAARATALSEQTAFGANPGNLRMLTYVPRQLREGAPLVVVLHGCTQTAGGYDFGTGWSTLAERHGFALLLPEQKRANNPNTCFTWFSPEDTTRGRGEALSIRQMVAHMETTHGIDRGRIYVTGLSAGGAMASVMLATYPELFAGGAIIAGLPYGCAATVQEAFDAMFQASPRPARAWGDLVRAASPHAGPWPKISVWHGSADATVKPANADAIVRQWADVHSVSAAPSTETVEGGHHRRVWHDAAGDPVIESYTIGDMAHGTPIGEGCGNAAPFILDVGISSSRRIAEFWNLTAAQPFASAERTETRKPDAATGRPAATILIDQEGRVLDERATEDGPTSDSTPGDERSRIPGIDPGSVITKALRAAGLMK